MKSPLQSSSRVGSCIRSGNRTRAFTVTTIFLSPLLVWSQSSAAERWSSYFGGVADDQVHAMASDEFGHVYVTGYTTDSLRLGNDTTGQSGLTHQHIYGGGSSDAFLAKVSPQGSVLWCTYFGGPGDDVGMQVVVTDMEGVLLVGNTTSAEGVATDTLSYQPVAGGGQDVFVARFTEYGALIGATYFGGADDEIATTAVLDHRGHLIIGGSTTGPACLNNGVFPSQPYMGGTDGLLIRFTGTDSLAAGTFIGGELDDALVQLTTGDSAGIFMAGNTTSSVSIATADAFTATPAGNGDGFVMLVDTGFYILQGTYFGGAAQEEVHGFARHGDLLAICGSTFSDSLYTDTASYQALNSGNGDGFIALLRTDLAVEGCTFYGDSSYDALTAVAFDTRGNCYSAGVTASNSLSLPGSQGAFFSGATDGWMMRLDSALAPVWSRYHGAVDEDEFHALYVQGITALFVGGRTASQQGYTSEGHQMEFGGGSWDGSAARFDQVISTPCTGFGSPTTTWTSNGTACNGISSPIQEYHVCLGDSVTLIAYGGVLGAAAEWMWYADGCGVPEHFITMGDTITFVATGSFLLSARAESLHHTSSCTSLPIVVHTRPEPEILVSDTVCVGEPVDVYGAGADSFTWALLDSTATGATALLPALDTAGLQHIHVEATNGPACTTMLDVPIIVLPLTDAAWELTSITCPAGSDGSITLLDTNDTFIIAWHPPGLEGPVLNGLTAGPYGVTLTDHHGCTSTDTLWLDMPAALLDSVTTTNAPCGGPSGSALVHASGPITDLTFDWGNGAGDMSYQEDLLPGTYVLLITNSAGCTEEVGFNIAPIGVLDVIVSDTILALDGTATLVCGIVPSDTLSSYEWSPPWGLDDPLAASTVCSTSDTIAYVITVTSFAGCLSSDTVLVIPQNTSPRTVVDPCGEAFMPDIFSPNADGLNDALCLMGGCFSSVSLNIYDHWGARVFKAAAQDPCWDGTNNGTPLPAGAYAFTLAAERTTGERIERRGLITLKR